MHWDKYDDHLVLWNNRQGVKKDGKWGFIDSGGNVVIDFKYDHVQSFLSESNNLSIVKIDGKEGLIDMNGNHLLECKYDKVYTSFYQGFYTATLNGKSIKINKSGQELSE